jgi:hypothetical protein
MTVENNDPILNRSNTPSELDKTAEVQFLSEKHEGDIWKLADGRVFQKQDGKRIELTPVDSKTSEKRRNLNSVGRFNNLFRRPPRLVYHRGKYREVMFEEDEDNDNQGEITYGPASSSSMRDNVEEFRQNLRRKKKLRASSADAIRRNCSELGDIEDDDLDELTLIRNDRVIPCELDPEDIHILETIGDIDVLYNKIPKKVKEEMEARAELPNVYEDVNIAPARRGSFVDLRAAAIQKKAVLLAKEITLAMKEINRGNVSNATVMLRDGLMTCSELGTRASLERVALRNKSMGKYLIYSNDTPIITKKMKEDFKRIKENYQFAGNTTGLYNNSFRRYQSYNNYRSRSYSGYNKSNYGGYNNSNNNFNGFLKGFQTCMNMQNNNNSFFHEGEGTRPTSLDPKGTPGHTTATLIKEGALATTPTKGGTDGEGTTGDPVIVLSAWWEIEEVPVEMAFYWWAVWSRIWYYAQVVEANERLRVFREEQKVERVSRVGEGDADIRSKVSGVAAEWDSQGNKLRRSYLDQSYSSCPQVEWGHEVGRRLYQSKPVYGSHSFQNGGYSNFEGFNSKRRLRNKLGFNLSLQPCTSTQIYAAPFRSMLGGKSVQIYRNAFRPQRRSACLFEDHENSRYCNSRNLECEGLDLPGRSYHPPPRPQSPSPNCGRSHSVPKVVRMDSKRGKVESTTEQDVEILGMAVQFAEIASGTSGGTPFKSINFAKTTTQKDIPKEEGYNQMVSEGDWRVEFVSNPVPNGESVLSQAESVQNKGGKQSGMERSVSPGFFDNGGSKRMDKAIEGEPTQFIKETGSTIIHNYYRRSPLRMGGDTTQIDAINNQFNEVRNRINEVAHAASVGLVHIESNLSDLRNVVTQNVSANQQSQGAGSHRFSVSSIPTPSPKGESEFSPNPYRQYNSNVQHKSKSSIPKSVCKSAKAIASGKRKQDKPTRSAHTGRGQRFYRRSQSPGDKRGLPDKEQCIKQGAKKNRCVSEYRHVCECGQSQMPDVLLSKEPIEVQVEKSKSPRKRVRSPLEVYDSLTSSTDSPDPEGTKQIRKRRAVSVTGSTGLEGPKMELSIKKVNNKKRAARVCVEDSCQRQWDEKKKSFITTGELKITFTEGDPSEQQLQECRHTMCRIIDFISPLEGDFVSRRGEYLFELILVALGMGVGMMKIFFSEKTYKWRKNSRRGWFTLYEFLESEDVWLENFCYKQGCMDIMEAFVEWLVEPFMELEGGLERCPDHSFNNIKSAVSSFFRLAFKVEVSGNPRINFVTRQRNKEHPSMARYIEAWDAGKLLDYFRTLDLGCKNETKSEEQKNDLHLRYLHQKVSGLLMFFCLLRPAEMLRIIIEEVKVVSEGLFVLTSIKTMMTRRSFVFVPSLPKTPVICPCVAITELINFYKVMNVQSIFLFSNKEGKQLPHASLSGLLKDLLARAGIDARFTAYSIKHAAISFLINRGVPLKCIEQAARYRSVESVITKHYAVIPTMKVLHQLMAEASVMNPLPKPMEVVVDTIDGDKKSVWGEEFTFWQIETEEEKKRKLLISMQQTEREKERRKVVIVRRVETPEERVKQRIKNLAEESGKTEENIRSEVETAWKEVEELKKDPITKKEASKSTIKSSKKFIIVKNAISKVKHSKDITGKNSDLPHKEKPVVGPSPNSFN